MTTYQKLSDVLQFIRGVTFSPEELVTGDESGAIACLRTKNIQKELDDSDLIYVPSSVVKRDEQALQEGDLLISSANSWELVGKTVRVGKLSYPATAGGFISILRPDRERIDPDYLFRFISWARTQHEIRHLGRQTTNISNLDRERFLELPIPLPPLPTQRHIAKVLEQADCLRLQAQQMENCLQELRRSVFLSSVGPEAEGYGAWRVMGVSELATADKNSMRTGPFGSALKHSEFVDSGVAVIGIDNAVLDRFQWKERRYISEEKYKGLKKYQVFPGDVIVTIMGTTGRSAIVPEDVPLAISTKHLATITLSSEKATPEFLKYAIQYHPLIAEQIAAQNKGAVMDGLNLGIIKNLKLPVPPLAIQQRLSRAMKALDTESETLAKGRENFEQLFSALMQRAFKGELTPKLA